VVRRKGTRSQEQLIPELKDAVDAARIADPVNGLDPLARHRLADLVQRDFDSVCSFKVQHNLGSERRDWLRSFVLHEFDVTPEEYDAWKPGDPWPAFDDEPIDLEAWQDLEPAPSPNPRRD